MYPNPAVNEINIAFDNSKNENCSINLLDVTGRTLISGSNIWNGNAKLNLSNVSKGMYFIEVRNEKNEVKGKVKVVVE